MISQINTTLNKSSLKLKYEKRLIIEKNAVALLFLKFIIPLFKKQIQYYIFFGSEN